MRLGVETAVPGRFQHSLKTGGETSWWDICKAMPCSGDRPVAGFAQQQRVLPSNHVAE